MSSLTRERRAARRLALDVLYQAEIRHQLPIETLTRLRRGGWEIPSDDHAGTAVPSVEAVDYAITLVEGVQGHSALIDSHIERSADRWALDRMPIVDRNLLRVALFELLWMPDVPVAVVINEAVELAKALSTETSGRFINGILGNIAASTDRGETS